MILRVLDHPNFVIWCFGLFILLRALILLIPLEMVSDADWYFSRAIGIAAGEGYSEGGHPTAYWPVGYPGFLSVLFGLFGSSQLVGAFANFICAAASFFLVLALTRHFFQSNRAAHLAVALLAIYPNNIAYIPLLLTETYFTFLMLLGIYLVVVRRTLLYLLLAGIVFGLLVLTKPQAVFVPAFLALLWLFTPDGWQHRWGVAARICIIYAMMASVLVPWAIRNTTVLGALVLVSTNGGANLLSGNNPSADGSFTADSPLFRQHNFSIEGQVGADKRARQLAMDWIKSNPKKFLSLIPLKIFHGWAPDGEGEWAYQAGFKNYDKFLSLFRSVRILNQAYYVLLIIGFVIAIIPLWRHRHKTAWPLPLFGYLFCSYLTVIAIVFFGHSRFHFPAMPWVIMTVAWAAVHLCEKRAAKTIPAQSK
ncbi:MAG: glycosyl transferase [Alphaproteobacteria bacterium]|nr:glycosyl transferase [Alphaproteobacteria bacterium]